MSQTMPVLFVGHGSPMNAIEENEFSRAWVQIASGLPRPKAIVCVSAHWETNGVAVTAMPDPRTIHDFYGFPRALSEVQYPAPGSPELAERICSQLSDLNVTLDQSWGLDHGTWSVLRQMYPAADIPVIQLSLARKQTPDFHYELGRRLQFLRTENVLVVGSGNIVHNLRLVAFNAPPFDWADEWDQFVSRAIEMDDHLPLIQYEQQGRAALLSINTAEHYLPLLYILGMKMPEDPVTFYNGQIFAASLSMRSVRIG